MIDRLLNLYEILIMSDALNDLFPSNLSENNKTRWLIDNYNVQLIGIHLWFSEVFKLKYKRNQVLSIFKLTPINRWKIVGIKII